MPSNLSTRDPQFLFNTSPLLQVASTQALVAMVKHFQHLFDVKRAEGVVTKMSQVFQSLEEMRNVMTHIKTVLNLGMCMCVVCVYVCTLSQLKCVCV